MRKLYGVCFPQPEKTFLSRKDLGADYESQGKRGNAWADEHGERWTEPWRVERGGDKDKGPKVAKGRVAPDAAGRAGKGAPEGRAGPSDGRCSWLARLRWRRLRQSSTKVRTDVFFC